MLIHKDSQAYDVPGVCGYSLYNAGARTYQTGMGRWLQEDPILGIPFDPMSFNRYSYCDQNPVEKSDPFGLAAEYTYEDAPTCFGVKICPGLGGSGVDFPTPGDFANSVAQGAAEDIFENWVEKISEHIPIAGLLGPAVEAASAYHDYNDSREAAIRATKPKFCNPSLDPDIQQAYNGMFPGHNTEGLLGN